MNQKILPPRDKSDFLRLNELIQAGPEAAEPILAELLEWLQDMNWPIAEPLANFLVTIGAPLVPHLQKVLRSKDDMWIYWVLQGVVSKLSSELVQQLERELGDLVRVAENDEIALDIIVKANVWERGILLRTVDNRINHLEKYLVQLKLLQKQLDVPSEARPS